MGSPLGPTFANFYMGHVENTIFENSSITPRLYTRYVDDIFLENDSEEQLIKIKKQWRHICPKIYSWIESKKEITIPRCPQKYKNSVITS